MKKRILMSMLCLSLLVCSVPGALAEESNVGNSQPPVVSDEGNTELPVPDAPPAPTVQSVTCKQIVLNPTEGCEYALVPSDGSLTGPVLWQQSPVFADVAVNTAYTAYQRYAATETHQTSAASVGLVVIPKHTERSAVTAPTCTEKGYTKHVCTVCGASYTDSETDALGHDYQSTVIAPTCTAKGYTKHTCTRCGTSYMDSEKAALGHSYQNTVVAPTCTAKGYTRHTCSRCGTSYTDSEKAALGHSYQNTVTAPTCTAKGYTKHTCTRCGTGYTDSGKAALGHKLTKTAAKKATCTKAGNNAYWTCSRCGKVFSDAKGTKATTAAQQQIKATGHSYKTVTTKATPSKNGSIRTTCKNCGKTKSSTTISRPKRIVLSKSWYAWDGSSHKPTVTVKNASGSTISSKHYSVSWPSNTKSAGKHTITVRFKGEKYSGTMTASYTIGAKSISGKKIHLSRSHYTYNGKVHHPTVTIAGLREGTDFTVSYSDTINAGIATVRVTGKGNYTGSVSKTFTIRPRRTGIQKLSARREGFYVRWKEVPSQISGYEVEYSRTGSFAKSQKVRVDVSKRSAKVLNLQGGKNYYVRVRTYKNVGNTRVYSKRSAVWQIQTKEAASA